MPEDRSAERQLEIDLAQQRYAGHQVHDAVQERSLGLRIGSLKKRHAPSHERERALGRIERDRRKARRRGPVPEGEVHGIAGKRHWAVEPIAAVEAARREIRRAAVRILRVPTLSAFLRPNRVLGGRVVGRNGSHRREPTQQHNDRKAAVQMERANGQLNPPRTGG